MANNTTLKGNFEILSPGTLIVGGATVSAGLDASAIAPAFSATATYALNAAVTRCGKLYKCSTAVETAGEWNDANWTETTVVALITNGE